MLKSRWKESGGKEEEEEFEVAMARKNGFTRNPFLRQLRIHFNCLIHFLSYSSTLAPHLFMQQMTLTLPKSHRWCLLFVVVAAAASLAATAIFFILLVL
jgi:hypothetical protein